MGGVAAVFGFRYQFLRTIEQLLTLYVSDRDGDWLVEVESDIEQKVDYAVWRAGRVARAVQVKGSMPGSATRLTEREARDILRDLATRFPGADEVAVESNRARSGPWVVPDRLDTLGAGPRVRVVHDDRSIGDLESDVRALLVRIRAGRGTTDALTLRRIALVLDAEVLRLGAQTTDAPRWFGPADVANVVDLNGQPLAELLGRVPWAQPWRVPRFDALPRGDVAECMSRVLELSALQEAGPPAVVTVAGFSGAGKSSAAVSWFDTHQQAYDLALWLPAYAADTLADAARQLLAAEHGDATFEWDVEQTRNAFVELLATTPLRWLLILDDLSDGDLARAWVPRSGFGHVIITTRDSALRPVGSAKFEMPPLDLDSVTRLACRHLGLDPSDLSQVQVVALERLHDVTGGWPLAVAMVLSWVALTGGDVADLDSYFDRLSDSLLDRSELVPDGYPATVVATIIEALDRLQAGPSNLPWQVLLACTRLGAQFVPTALIQEVVTRLAPGTTKIDIDEAIIALRQLSLVRRGPLPGSVDPQWADRVTINDIIADLADQLADDDPDQGNLAAIETLSAATVQVIDAHQYALAASLTPMIENFLRAIWSGNRPWSIEALSLHGNLAKLHVLRNQPAKALRLLAVEVNAAAAFAQNKQLPSYIQWVACVLNFQSLVLVAQIRHRLGDDRASIGAARQAVRTLWVLSLNGSLHQLRDHGPKGLADVLEAINHPGVRQERDDLLAAIDQLLGPLPSRPVQHAEKALREGEPATALALASEALEHENDPVARLDLHMLLAEAQASTNLEAAVAVVDRIAEDAEALGLADLHAGNAAIAVGLVALATWMAETVEGLSRNETLSTWALHQTALAGLLPHLPSAGAASPPDDLARAELLRAAHAVLIGSPDSVARLVDARHTLNAARRSLIPATFGTLEMYVDWLNVIHRSINPNGEP